MAVRSTIVLAIIILLLQPMRKYVAELFGTFFLMLIIGVTLNPISIGFGLALLVYLGAHISGAHYNPAITFAFLLQKKITPKESLGYIVSQLLGATLAAVVVGYATKNSVNIFVNNGALPTVWFLGEALFTFLLVYTVLTFVLTKKLEDNPFYGFMIGTAVMVGIFAVGAISGSALNPALALGSFLGGYITHKETVDLNRIFLYTFAPLLGAILAHWFYTYLNQPETEKAKKGSSVKPSGK